MITSPIRKFGTYFLSFCAIFLSTLIFASVASAATITWDGGGTDSNWSTAENWDTDTVPLETDDVVFDSTSTTDSTIDTTFEALGGAQGKVNSITIESTYTGTLTIAKTVMIRTYGFTQNGGTVNVVGSLNGRTDITINAGTFNGSGSILSDDLAINGGTFTAPSIVYVYDDLTVGSSATFNHNNGQFHFSPRKDDKIGTIDGSFNLYKATFVTGRDTNDYSILAAGSTLVIEDKVNFLHDTNIVTDTGATIEMQGDVNMGFYEADAHFTFSGTADQAVERDVRDYYSPPTRLDITVNKTSGTVTFEGPTYYSCHQFNDVTVTSGTLDCNSKTVFANFYGDLSIDSGTFVAPSRWLEIDGSMSLGTSGTFTNSSAEIILTSTDAVSITGDFTFYDLTCEFPGKTITFEAGSTTTVSNEFTVNGNATGYVTLVSSSPGTEWYLDVLTPSVSYVDVTDSNASGGSTISASSTVDGGNNTNWSISAPSSSAIKMMEGTKSLNPAKTQLGDKEKKWKEGDELDYSIYQQDALNP